jgi:hypothetical protein
MLARCKVSLDDVSNEIAGGCRRRGFFAGHAGVFYRVPPRYRWKRTIVAGSGQWTRGLTRMLSISKSNNLISSV